MRDKASTAERSATIRVSECGSLSMDIGPGSFGAGFSQLMDLAAPRFIPKPLAAGETTKAGFLRTGDAIARALAKARDRFGD